MKKLIYVPVKIESEADFPKENGDYFCFTKQSKRNITLHWWSSEGQYGINVWMRTVDWYLKPVELPDEEDMNGEANNYGDLVKKNVDNNYQDYGVEENASLDFLRGANWFKSQILK